MDFNLNDFNSYKPLVGNVEVIFEANNYKGTREEHSFCCFIDAATSVVTRYYSIKEMAESIGRLRFLFNVNVIKINKCV